MLTPKSFRGWKPEARPEQQKRTRRKKRPEEFPVNFDSLEERTMLDGAGLALDADALAGVDFAEAVMPIAPIAAEPITQQQQQNDNSAFLSDTTSLPQDHRALTAHQLVFVDSSVNDHESLLAGVVQDGGRVDVFVLDQNRDGIEQITETLLDYDDVSSIHILSHGDSGALQLGDSLLTAGSLADHADAITSWRGSLVDGADILLYGCNVAYGEWGVDFVQDFAALSGADVAASDDVTGDVKQGGDWDFEYTTGWIDTSVTSVFSQSALDTYSYTFDVTQDGDQLTITGTAGDDTIVIEGTGSVLAGFLDGGITVSGVAGGDDFTGVNSVVVNSLGGNDVIQIDTGIDPDSPLFLVNVFGSQILGIGGEGIQFAFDGGTGNLDIASARDLTIVNKLVSQGDITVTAGDLHIDDNTLVSTESLIAGNHVADSGNLVLLGDEIIIDAGVQLLAGGGNGFAAGDVTLAAEATKIRTLSLPILNNFSSIKSEVTINNATIEGGDITILAVADDLSPVAQPEPYLQDYIGNLATLVESIPGMVPDQFPSLNASVNIRGSDAMVRVTDTSIVSDGTVDIMSTSRSDASLQALATNAKTETETNTNMKKSRVNKLAIAAGVGRAVADSETLIEGTTTIDAAGSVLIISNASAIANVTATTNPAVGKSKVKGKKNGSPKHRNPRSWSSRQPLRSPTRNLIPMLLSLRT